MQSFVKYTYICLLSFLVSCGKPATLEPLSGNATVLAFGDSLTAGVGVGSEQSYPSVLSRHLGFKVINAGVPGEVSAEGKARLMAMLETNRPDLVLLCHGGNDFLHRLPLADTEKNLRDMVEHLKSLGVGVLLIGVPQPGIWGNPPELYGRVASEFAVPLENDILGELETNPAMKSDPVHLNEPGYEQLADAVMALLVRAGAIP